MSEETTKVEETKTEVTGTEEETKSTDKVIPQENVNKLVAQAKSKGMEEARKNFLPEIDDLKNQIEELKTKDMPEEEAKSYKQKKAEKDEQERIQAIEKREQLLSLKENTMKAKDQLSQKNVNQNYVRFLIDSNEFETIDDKLEAFVDMFTEDLENSTQERVKQVLAGKSPKVNTKTGQVMTKQQINEIKDPFERKQKIAENPHLFQK